MSHACPRLGDLLARPASRCSTARRKLVFVRRSAEATITFIRRLPWFFRRLFEQYYSGTCFAAIRAFVEAMGTLGSHYWEQYEGGNRDVIGVLAAEEAKPAVHPKLGPVQWLVAARDQRHARIAAALPTHRTARGVGPSGRRDRPRFRRSGDGGPCPEKRSIGAW